MKLKGRVSQKDKEAKARRSGLNSSSKGDAATATRGGRRSRKDSAGDDSHGVRKPSSGSKSADGESQAAPHGVSFDAPKDLPPSAASVNPPERPSFCRSHSQGAVMGWVAATSMGGSGHHAQDASSASDHSGEQNGERNSGPSGRGARQMPAAGCAGSEQRGTRRTQGTPRDVLDQQSEDAAALQTRDYSTSCRVPQATTDVASSVPAAATADGSTAAARRNGHSQSCTDSGRASQRTTATRLKQAPFSAPGGTGFRAHGLHSGRHSGLHSGQAPLLPSCLPPMSANAPRPLRIADTRALLRVRPPPTHHKKPAVSTICRELHGIRLLTPQTPELARQEAMMQRSLPGKPVRLPSFSTYGYCRPTPPPFPFAPLPFAQTLPQIGPHAPARRMKLVATI